MIRMGILLTVMWYAHFSFGQYSTVQAQFYYDSDWNLVDPQFGQYEWISGIDEYNFHFQGPVTVSAPDGQVIIRGQYNKGRKVGYWKLIYGNGVTYCEGEFRNNNKKGLWTYRYPDNSILQEVEISSKDFIVKSSFDEQKRNRIRNGTGKWIWNTYIGNEPVVFTGKFEKRKKVGDWSLMYQNGDTILTESYDKGNFITGHVHADGKQIETEAAYINADIFTDRFVERMENFSLTHQASERGYPILQFLPELPYSSPYPRLTTLNEIFSNIAYNYFWAVLDRSGYVNGKVEVSFIVSKEGKFEAFRITKGLTQEVNEIITKSFYQMPLWDIESPELLIGKPFFLTITIE